MYKKIYFDELDSTNKEAKKIAEQNKKELKELVVISKTQFKGQGNHNRIWKSHEGGLYFSILLRPEAMLPLFSLMAGVAVIETLKELVNLDFKIKWPNDVLFNKNKISGILTECKFIGNTLDYVIVGCGININQKDFDDFKNYKATSLYLLTGKEFDLNSVLDIYLKHFNKLYFNYINSNSEEILDKLNKYSVLKDKKVIVDVGENIFIIGKVIGINSDGGLIIKKENQKNEIIYSGSILSFE